MWRITRLCIGLLLAVVYAGCDTAGNVDPVFKSTFIKYYGTEGDQFASDLLVNGDGTILILGNSVSLSGVRTAFVTKVNAEGNVIWEKTIGAEGQTAVDLETIKSIPDEFVVALNYDEAETSRIQLLRMRQDGTVLDPGPPVPLHNSDPETKQVIRSITSLESGEFVITGMADRTLIKETLPVDESNDQSDILAFRLDANLTLIDTVVTKGGEQNGCGIKAFELKGMNAGKLVLFSYTDRPFLSNEFRYNFSFDIINAGTPVGKLIGSDNDDEFLSSAIEVTNPLNGEGYLMAGTARSTPGGPGDLYLVKYDRDFQQKAIDVRLSLQRNLECVAADNASSGYLILANEQPEGSLRDIALVKVNREGGFEWSTSFGTREGDDTSTAIGTLPDGRIAILATMQLQTKKKVALIVLKDDGNF
jgi:hypothetical protein